MGQMVRCGKMQSLARVVAQLVHWASVFPLRYGVSNSDRLRSRLRLDLGVERPTALLEGSKGFMRAAGGSKVGHEPTVYFLAPGLDPQNFPAESRCLLRLSHLGVNARRVTESGQVRFAQPFAG